MLAYVSIQKLLERMSLGQQLVLMQPSGLLHQTDMHTELEKERHTLGKKDGRSSPPPASGFSVLAHNAPASGQPAWRFDVLHLPYLAL